MPSLEKMREMTFGFEPGTLRFTLGVLTLKSRGSSSRIYLVYKKLLRL